MLITLSEELFYCFNSFVSLLFPAPNKSIEKKQSVTGLLLVLQHPIDYQPPPPPPPDPPPAEPPLPPGILQQLD